MFNMFGRRSAAPAPSPAAAPPMASIEALLTPLPYNNRARVVADAQVLRTHVPSLSYSISPCPFTAAGYPSTPQLHFSGTVPIHYHGVAYNIPMSIYVPEQYPMRPPLAIVTPTKDMRIKDGHQHVDVRGVVYLPYLNQWHVSQSSLIEMITIIMSVFSADPPVFRIPSTSSSSSSSSSAAAAPASNPPTQNNNYSAATNQNTNANINVYGSPQPLYSQTVIPPANAYLNTAQFQSHSPPPLTANNNNNNAASASSSSSAAGLLQPQSHNANHHGLYTGSSGYQTAAVNAPSSSQSRVPFSSSSASPSLPNNNAPLPAPQPLSSPPSAAAAAAAAVFIPPSPSPPPSSSVSSAAAAAAAVAVSSSSSSSSSSSTPQSHHASLVAALTPLLQQHYIEMHSDAQHQLNALIAQQDQLEQQQQSMKASLTQLQSQHAQYQSILSNYTQKEVELKEWLDKYGDAAMDEKDIDKLVYPTDTLSKQLLEAVSADHAYDDALYVLDRLFQDNFIDFTTYTKQIRNIARKQFAARALTMKIQEKQKEEMQKNQQQHAY